MLKRTNKVAALLVAATSVASLAPAGVMAADYTRISSDDATVYSAKAFKDGSYVIDGNLVDEDTDAVYYVKDGKYTELEDVDSGSTLSLYGDHYISVDSGDYYIDLNTGKVTDDDIADDNRDDLQTTLRKQFKDIDRYGSPKALPEFAKELPNAQYGEVWYSVGNVGDNHIKVVESDNINVEGTNADVYTDLDGNYIDANYNLGSIKVTTSSAEVEGDTKLSSITNSEDEEDGANDSQIRAFVVPGSATVIAQDDNNIYRTAKINVYVDDASKAVITKINGVKVKDNDIFDSSTADVASNGDKKGVGYTFTVIQKISKAQASDEIDDAKYAKTVTNYIVSDKEGAQTTKVGAFNTYLENKDGNVKFTVANGNLVAYRFNEDSSDKDKSSIDVVSAELKSKGPLNYLDVKSATNEDCVAYDTDVNGNLYRLKDGYIYKFDNDDDWNKLYRVDGSMDEFSVYDSNDMVVWNEDDEVYSLIGSNASNNDADNNDSDNTESNTPAVTAGWNQASNGTWTYVNADGTLAKGWFQSPYSGKWFYMDLSTGVMQTGWVQSPYSGKWFFMDLTNGDMQTGWVQSPYSGKWFYMNPSNGDMMTGWIQSPYSGKWYYMGSDGAMLTNTTVNGYVLGADGAWVR